MNVSFVAGINLSTKCENDEDRPAHVLRYMAQYANFLPSCSKTSIYAL